jgi:predicted nucleic acid-binding protein
LAKAEDLSLSAAWRALDQIRSHPAHVYWDDGFSYAEVDPQGLTGRKQVTDAWLVTLARRPAGTLATLDRALTRISHQNRQKRYR